MTRLAMTEHERVKHRDEGFTLLELMFASVYLAIGLLAVAAMVAGRVGGTVAEGDDEADVGVRLRLIHERLGATIPVGPCAGGVRSAPLPLSST